MAERCNCDACVSDPDFTCSYTGDDISVEAVYIANAYKGHMILSPGGDNGEIGGLLHQLQPPQHYSHMGIMVADFDLIRHCTASPSRLSAEEYYTGTVLGVSAPVDGLNPDHVQFGWPGTITQSIEQALFADHYGDLPPPGHAGPYKGAHLTDPGSPSGKAYKIAALSFDTVIDGGKEFPALVVKPCPLLETPAVRAAVGRVADQAMKMYAYYSFYCYTDGSVGNFPDFFSLPVNQPDAQPDWDLVAHKWKDWSNPDDVKWVRTATIPGVCSSFIWQAVQEVNKAVPPKLVLDWADSLADALGEAGGKCKRTLPIDPAADTIDSFTLDGLYFYDQETRKRAAVWLQGSISRGVFESLKSNLRDQGGLMKVIAGAIDDVGRGAFIAAAEAGATAVLSLLSIVVTPIVAVALDVALAEQLIELLYDMPEDIGNQICNSFAFDCHRGFPGDTHCVDADGNEITDVDSQNWADAPGVGRCVSPDNIYMFWDAPTSDPDRERVQGLYGYNVPVQPVVAVVRRPVCELVPSTGTATIQGFVLLNGEVVAGAYVKVNCQHTISDGRIGYSLSVRSGGHYKLVARYEDPVTHQILYGERATGRPPAAPIAPGSVVTVDIHVSAPPECLRKVTVRGKIRVDDVYLTGADHGDTTFVKDLYVQHGVPNFNEDDGTWKCDPDDPAGQVRQTDVAGVGCTGGEVNAGLKIDVTANADLSIDVTLTGTVDNLVAVRMVNVPSETSRSVHEFSLDTGGPFNDRAFFRGITISNTRAQAI